LLVPRTSSTLVTAWSCPTWVVSRRRVLEVVFILLEPLSPSRRIFIGSHSLPLSSLPFRFFEWYQSRLQVLIDSNQSKIQGWHMRNGVHVLHTSMAKTTRCGVSGWQRSSAERVRSFGMSWWTQLCPTDELPHSRIEGHVRRQQQGGRLLVSLTVST
jgi:hypothetical protein